MRALPPRHSDFQARLQRDGWKFAISYILVVGIAVWNTSIAPMTLGMIAFAVTAVNLVQTALTAGYAYNGGFLRQPDMATMPMARRYAYYSFDGLHLCVVMIGILDASYVPLNMLTVLLIGLAGALGSAIGSERRLHKEA